MFALSSTEASVSQGGWGEGKEKARGGRWEPSWSLCSGGAKSYVRRTVAAIFDFITEEDWGE